MAITEGSTNFPQDAGARYGEGWKDASGNLYLPRTRPPGTGLAYPDYGGVSISIPHLDNGASLDAMHNSIQGTLLANTARTTTTYGPNTPTFNLQQLLITLVISAAPNTAETLQLVYFPLDLGLTTPALNNNVNMTNYSITTVAGSSLQSAYPSKVGLAIGPGLSAPPQNTTWLEAYSAGLTPKFVIGVYPSASSAWTYSVTYSLK